VLVLSTHSVGYDMFTDSPRAFHIQDTVNITNACYVAYTGLNPNSNPNPRPKIAYSKIFTYKLPLIVIVAL